MNLTREQREKKALKILYGSQIISVINTELYLVESESDPDTYYQVSSNTCTCPYHTAYQEECKHIIALQFMKTKTIYPMHMEIENTADFIQKHSQHKKEMMQKIIFDTTRDIGRLLSKQYKQEYEKKFEDLKSKLNSRITKLKDEIEDLKAKRKEVKLKKSVSIPDIMRLKPLSKEELKNITSKKPQKCNPKELKYKSDKYGF